MVKGDQCLVCKVEECIAPLDETRRLEQLAGEGVQSRPLQPRQRNVWQRTKVVATFVQAQRETPWHSTCDEAVCTCCTLNVSQCVALDPELVQKVPRPTITGCGVCTTRERLHDDGLLPSVRVPDAALKQLTSFVAGRVRPSCRRREARGQRRHHP